MSMKDARSKELQFFHSSRDYGGLKNVGTGYLSTELSDRLISSVRRQLPNISGFVNKSIMDLQASRGWQGRTRGGWTARQAGCRQHHACMLAICQLQADSVQLVGGVWLLGCDGQVAASQPPCVSAWLTCLSPLLTLT